MTKLFHTLALVAVTALPILGATAATATSGLTFPTQSRVQGTFLPDTGNTPRLGVWQAQNDPFNPLPHAEPISRTRIDVFVTDEMTQCPRIWSTVPCSVVVLENGEEAFMAIGNYTHEAPGFVTLERIEYAISVTFTDAWPLYFVAVED